MYKILACIICWKKDFCKIDMQKYASKIYFHVKCITILYGVLIVIDYSLHIFQATERYGLRSEQLMYTHPTVLVACCVFLIIILLSLKKLCNRRQEIYNNTIAHNVFYFKKQSFWSRTCNYINMLFCVCSKEKNNAENNVAIIPLVVILGWDQIQYYFFSSIIPDSARYQITYKSV